MLSNPWLLVTLLSGSVCLLEVLGAPAPGVYVENREVSCCEQLKIPIDRACLNRILSEDTVKARVKGNNVEVLEPFHFLQDENVIQVPACVNFTHQINCDVGGNQEREDNIHYLATPCHKEDGAPNAAVANQGSYMCLLLTVALLMVRLR